MINKMLISIAKAKIAAIAALTVIPPWCHPKRSKKRSSHLRFANLVQMLCSCGLHWGTGSRLHPLHPLVFPQCLNCLWQRKWL